MRPDTQNWIALSDYDLETARHMLATGRFLYVIFMCHLALEKMLKAHFTEVTQSIPPKTHDLIYLIRRVAGITTSAFGIYRQDQQRQCTNALS
jgi:HEPN domain-containing protein